MEGDKIYTDYQYEFRGLLFGSRTGIVCEGVEGLLSMADIEPTDLPKPAGLGMFKGEDKVIGKSVVANLRPTGAAHSGIAAVLRQMRAAFQNTPDEHPFVFKRPDEPKMRVYVRCRKRDIPTSYELANGLGEATVQLDATDPRIYSNDEHTETFQIPNAQASATFALYMNGDFVYGTQPVIEIDGPVTDPVIANLADGNKQIYIDYTIAPGSTMVIDIKRRTVEVDGVNVYGPGVVLPGTRWWSLLPGQNDITITRTNGAAAVADVTVRWRDAYA